jgi:fructan beta-fructosidase
MSNWLYAQQVPTEKWRSAMTIARELKMRHIGNDILVTSLPVKELSVIKSKPVILKNLSLTNKGTSVNARGKTQIPCLINLTMDQATDFSIVLSNNLGEEVQVGFDKATNQYFIDRTKSGKIDFNKEFAARHFAPRFSMNPKMNLTLVIDVSSVELFADDGLSVMTEIFFPNKPFDQVRIASPGKAVIKQLEYSALKK